MADGLRPEDCVNEVCPWSGDPVSADSLTLYRGKVVQLEDTVRSFKAVVDGEYDHLPENAFYMVGGIDEAIEKAKKLAEEA